MKTYTLTWRNSNKWTKTGLRRMRWWIGSIYWRKMEFGALEAFLDVFRFGLDGVREKELRLVSNGRLVARSATYQGV